MRKIQWVLHNKKGEMLGVFPTKKKAFAFFGDDEENILTKLVWNGFYYSEKPLDYDPYVIGTISVYDPMF